MKTYCTNCTKVLDDNTGLGNENKNPKPGDISVCLYCANLMQFDAGFNLIRITESELINMKLFDPLTYSMIESLVQRILSQIIKN